MSGRPRYPPDDQVTGILERWLPIPVCRRSNTTMEAEIPAKLLSGAY